MWPVGENWKRVLFMFWKKDDFTISTEKGETDVNAIRDLLRHSHWAGDRSKTDIEQSVEHSICFYLRKTDDLIGFARVLTDRTVYAIVLDMIIKDDFRGRKLGTWLMHCICDHPKIILLKKILWTTQAVDFYKKDGFEQVPGLKLLAKNWKR